jgi:beta-phosphoglucomutase family hydrolase
VTVFPVKQGGLATQQADVVAETIASEAGVPVQATPLDPVLRALLLTGDRPAYLRAALGGHHGDPGVVDWEPLWWPPAKVAGLYLASHFLPRTSSSRTTGSPEVMAAEINLGAMEAVIFDLDGVVTRTAEVHAEAWKQLFAEYLAARARRLGEPFKPFDRGSDYRRFVDGKPRYEGVASFLGSRGIELPFGSPDDTEERETVCGLGNRKNRYFLDALARKGADPYPTTLALIARLRRRGMRIAIVSSSRNCGAVLEAGGIGDLFDAKVDGIDAAELGLAGKPDPTVFVAAARRLGVDPLHAAVIEDAIAGVEAGRRGGFGLVVGVDRGAAQSEALAAAGADVVVGDLGELAA